MIHVFSRKAEGNIEKADQNNEEWTEDFESWDNKKLDENKKQKGPVIVSAPDNSKKIMDFDEGKLISKKVQYSLSSIKIECD